MKIETMDFDELRSLEERIRARYDQILTLAKNEANARFQDFLAYREHKSPAPYHKSELIYSASARCECGAGLAYLEKCGDQRFWACSNYFLCEPLGPECQTRFPFSFYEIKSERQPSSNGWTTRPAGLPK